MNTDRLQEIRAAGILTEEEIAALEHGERLRAPEAPRYSLACFVVSWMGLGTAAWALASGEGRDAGWPPLGWLVAVLLPVAALLLGTGAPPRRMSWSPPVLSLKGRAIAWATLVLLALILLRRSLDPFQ
jgi:hypothetical protein